MRNNYIKYYRFFNNDTSVTEVSVNDFKPPITKRSKRAWLNGSPVDILCSIPLKLYLLQSNEALSYGYTDRSRAISMAKASAISHLKSRITEIELSIKSLKNISIYSGLNSGLLKIRLLELQQELKA